VVAWRHGEKAPPPMSGETSKVYRVRLAKRFQEFCPEFKEVDLGAIADEKIFSGIESRIYADATKAADIPNAPEDRLLERNNIDPRIGQRINTFHGQHTFIHFLKRPSRRVTRLGLRAAN
jgi:hypothetical protein